MLYPVRRYPRLKDYDYSENGMYFITTCAIQRKHVFTDEEFNLTLCGKIAEEQLFALEKRFPIVRIDRYIIMPDHIHVIIELSSGNNSARLTGGAGENNTVRAPGKVPRDDGKHSARRCPHPTKIIDVVCAYKSLTTLECKRKQIITEKQLFQKSFYDHIIRSEADYERICKYIEENPLSWDITLK